MSQSRKYSDCVWYISEFIIWLVFTRAILEWLPKEFRQPISMLETKGVMCILCSCMVMCKALCALVKFWRQKSSRTNSYGHFCRTTLLIEYCSLVWQPVISKSGLQKQIWERTQSPRVIALFEVLVLRLLWQDCN